MLAYFRCIGAIFIGFAVFVAWNSTRGGILAPAQAAPNSAPLWTPWPDVAALPPTRLSRDICDRASELKAQFRAASVRTVILGYAIEANGMIHDIEVAASSGSKALDNAIVACVATLRFRPLPNRQAMLVEWK